ncbi:hypothetical protein Ahy_B07g086416 isoform A [Arachis hypogaea]|uniref:Uncharacterized protein n=1 Tax=Arachis hypogaea TaxID=3818 RepID=A0A444Y9L1_ARAHY|nr:hypothetical protein Ahy_B07g086416 isoform A [Arachis hypogaea]
MKTKVRLSKSLNCNATMTETFKYTHTLKENKERFANQRFTDHYRLEAVTQQSQHIEDDGNNYAASEVDPNTIWHETAFESYMNRTFIRVCYQSARRSRGGRRFEGVGVGAHPKPSPIGSAATGV